MFLGHLVEDFLEIHLTECAHFNVNGYQGGTPRDIRDWNFQRRIDELAKIYQHQTDGSIRRLVSGLHLLRLIRNNLAHAFTPQVGKDLLTEEGRDQLIAMLKHIAKWTLVHLHALRKVHFAILEHFGERGVPSADFPKVGTVARSKIQNYLAQLCELNGQDPGP